MKMQLFFIAEKYKKDLLPDMINYMIIHKIRSKIKVLQSMYFLMAN
jgi:hypothetical protein